MTWKGWEDYVPPSALQGTASDNLLRVRQKEPTVKPSKRSKFGAVKTTVDGITFDSKKEAARYQELKALQAAGEIWDLELQPTFPLCVPSTTGTLMGAAKAIAGTFDGRIGEYRADFAYYDRSGRVVEDVKSKPTKTPIWRWKIKHLRAQYGITVRET